MNSIITFLIQFNQSLLVKIQELLSVIDQLAPAKPAYDIKSPKYKAFSVDKPPIVRQFEKLDHKALMREHLRLFGKPVKPIKRRSGTPVNPALKCPYCGAHHTSISTTIREAGGNFSARYAATGLLQEALPFLP